MPAKAKIFLLIAGLILVALVDAATSGADSPRAQISYVKLWADDVGASLGVDCAASTLKPDAGFADYAARLSRSELAYPNGNRLLRNVVLALDANGNVTMTLVLEKITMTRFVFVPITAIDAGREMVFGGRCENGKLDWKLLRTTLDKRHLPSELGGR